MWRKSSHSNPNGACVECASWAKSSHSGNSGGNCLEWRKSARCQTSECLEAQLRPGGVQVRDSQLTGPGGANASPVLSFSPAAWTAFITGIR